MKLEDLKSVIGDEAYAKLTQAIGDQEVLIGAKGTIIPKARLDEVIADRDAQKAKVTELEGQVKTLNDGAKGLTDITTERDNLKKQVEESEAKHKAQLLDMKLEHFVEGKHAKDKKIILGQFDKTKLSLDEKTGDLVGVNEQFDALYKGHEYLFEATQPNAIGNPAVAPNVTTTKTEMQKLQDL